ncbi:MAG TPA: nitroreductase family protein, partial [Candidatus Atribacteria bacterium]|nr:nitroreductase family protein [Candidatus Atribacteria bacterium]
MEFSDVLRTRRAVRSYRRDPVPQDKLDRLKEALQLAPSGNN